jgi:hypothetical protein
MANPHEMAMIDGQIRAVYTDGRGRRYYIVDGRRRYLNLR